MYSSYIIRVINLRAGPVARVGNTNTTFWLEILNRSDIGLGGRIILKIIVGRCCEDVNGIQWDSSSSGWDSVEYCITTINLSAV